MTTIGAERPYTKFKVILGVDTHLDFQVAVAVSESRVRALTKAIGFPRPLVW